MLTTLHVLHQYQTNSVADPKGGAAGAPPPKKKLLTMFFIPFCIRMLKKAQIAQESINPQSFQGPGPQS